MYEYAILKRKGDILKRIVIFVLMSLIVGILSGCFGSEPESYAQEFFPAPSRIDVRRDIHVTSYDKETDTYRVIYDALCQNWWKISEQEEDFIDAAYLYKVEKLKQIKTTSNKRYVSEEDILIECYFEEEPLKWTKSATEIIDVGHIWFFLPKYTKQDALVKGYCVVFRAGDRPDYSEGVYTYYYSNDVFEALSESGQEVTTILHEKPMVVDVEKSTGITYEAIQPKLIEVNGWTHLREHSVYHNEECVIINYMFSKNASDKEVESAAKYWNTLQVLRGKWTLYPDMTNLWLNIPVDENVLIQVYKGEELVSQNLYSNIENGIIYREEYYSKF